MGQINHSFFSTLESRGIKYTIIYFYIFDFSISPHSSFPHSSLFIKCKNYGLTVWIDKCFVSGAWLLAGARVPRCRAWAVVSDNYCWCMERRGAQSGRQPAHTSQGFHVNIKHMPGIWYNFLSLVPTMTMPGAQRTLHTDTGHSQNSQHSCCWIWSTDKLLSLSRAGTISFS